MYAVERFQGKEVVKKPRTPQSIWSSITYKLISSKTTKMKAKTKLK